MGSRESLWLPTKDSAILSTNASNKSSFSSSSSSSSELSAWPASSVRGRLRAGDAPRHQADAEPSAVVAPRRRLRLTDRGETLLDVSLSSLLEEDDDEDEDDGGGEDDDEMPL